MRQREHRREATSGGPGASLGAAIRFSSRLTRYTLAADRAFSVSANS
jgi:hypothetical protein